MLRCHAAAHHSVCFSTLTVPDSELASQHQYCKWCKEHIFKSMLPEDSRQCKEAASESGLHQMALSSHFADTEVSIPYSNKVFEDATIQWLVHTNQVGSFVSLAYYLTESDTSLYSSQSRHSLTQGSRRCLTLPPEQPRA